MSRREEDIQIPIVIRVEQRSPPTGFTESRLKNTTLRRNIRKGAVPTVLIENIVFIQPVRNKEIQIAIGIVIAPADAHPTPYITGATSRIWTVRVRER